MFFSTSPNCQHRYKTKFQFQIGKVKASMGKAKQKLHESLYAKGRIELCRGHHNNILYPMYIVWLTHLIHVKSFHLKPLVNSRWLTSFKNPYSYHLKKLVYIISCNAKLKLLTTNGVHVSCDSRRHKVEILLNIFI